MMSTEDMRIVSVCVGGGVVTMCVCVGLGYYFKGSNISVGFIPSFPIWTLKINEFPHGTFQHTLVHAALRVSTEGNV